MLLKLGQRNLTNRYFVLRHGESTANVAGIVSSTYKVAVQNHGLTSKGIDQAKQSANTLISMASVTPSLVDSTGKALVCTSKAMLSADNDVVFYASDFARAYETAYHCRESLLKADLPRSGLEAQRPTPSFFTSSLLRERNFGDFEGAPAAGSYDQVWDKDVVEPITSNHFNTESIASVLTRVISLITEIEEIFNNKIVVLVSHGDVCQITQTAFKSMDGRTHRSLPHMNNCDIRELLFDESLYHE